jgi:hypothetical protein
MNLRRFVFSLVAIIISFFAFFLLLGFFELPLLWLARYGFPSVEPVEMLAGIAGGHPAPSPLGYAFLAIIILSSLVIVSLLYRTLSKAIATFSFLSNYYIKIYKAFIAGLLMVAWIVPTLWVFFPFKIWVVASITGGVVSIAFATISVLLNKVLKLVDADGFAEKAAIVEGDRR